MNARPPPWSWLRDWKPPADRDAARELARAEEGRDPEFVQKRKEAMAADAPTFLRGAAGVMAVDLASTREHATGIEIEICGDAHLGNFGMYGSPERVRVFDLTDFDEARPGPWEWDVCRLAASVVVTARDRGVDRAGQERGVRATIAAYCTAVEELASLPLIERWYAFARGKKLKRGDLADAGGRVLARAQDLLDGADDATQRGTVKDFTAGGEFKAGDRVTPLADDAPKSTSVRASYDGYVENLSDALGRLLRGYRPAAVAERPAGQGSLGLQNYLLLVRGRRKKDALILQVKEATPSQLGFGLEPYPAEHEGERVVRMQRALQAVSDPLLGWTLVDGQDFYVRQFRDRKGTAELLRPKGQKAANYADDLAAFGRLCGVTLARAHARAADGRLTEIGENLGAGSKRHARLADALVGFARTYADVTEDDHRALAERERQARP
jgi:uncharacterized protein (DUF2252 family)